MPKDPIKQYAERIDQVVNSYFPGGKIAAQIRSVEQAETFIEQCDLCKKELALLKKEISSEKAEIRAEYADARADLQSSSARSGLFGKKVGKMVRFANTNKRANLRQDQQSDMARFDELLRAIDERLITIDRVKIQVKQALASHKA